MTIKCDKGGTRIEGTTIETIQDFINIINAVMVALEDELPEEDATEIMKQAGRLAFAKRHKNAGAEAAAFREITGTLYKNSKI